ncbi:MAG: hypothetical protein LAP21_17040 [Acidobacteriia bacterium]|nr:hypothetical protein [Terriglobia bacterium]
MALPIILLSNENIEARNLVELTLQACEVARSAASQAVDGLLQGSERALQEVRKCEERLDDLDRELDQRLAPVITRITPEGAHELLACMKVVLDLERIGDLIVSFTERAVLVHNRIDMEDVNALTRMACVLENMLDQASKAFVGRSVDQALNVLRTDAEMDRLRSLLMVRHTESSEGLRGEESLQVLFMATALERAGDHAKNIAEETCHLATGHTVRHLIRGKDASSEQLFLDWLAQQSVTRA